MHTKESGADKPKKLEEDILVHVNVHLNNIFLL